jgi:hypothetical protein
MNTKALQKGGFLVFCLIGMLAAPVLAAPAENAQGNAFAKMKAADAGLKTDLWNDHIKYRLLEFDLHVQHADDIIGILNDHGINTTKVQSIADTFSGKREELETALKSQDREALKTINRELFSLAKEFLKEMRAAIRGHSASTRALPVSESADITGTGFLSTDSMTEAAQNL